MLLLLLYVLYVRAMVKKKEVGSIGFFLFHCSLIFVCCVYVILCFYFFLLFIWLHVLGVSQWTWYMWWFLLCCMPFHNHLWKDLVYLSHPVWIITTWWRPIYSLLSSPFVLPHGPAKCAPANGGSSGVCAYKHRWYHPLFLDDGLPLLLLPRKLSDQRRITGRSMDGIQSIAVYCCALGARSWRWHITYDTSWPVSFRSMSDRLCPCAIADNGSRLWQSRHKSWTRISTESGHDHTITSSLLTPLRIYDYCTR